LVEAAGISYIFGGLQVGQYAIREVCCACATLDSKHTKLNNSSMMRERSFLSSIFQQQNATITL
jgi:hypothetical protein